MGWSNITGEQNILPSGGNGNEMIFEVGKPKRFRVLLGPGEEPYSFFQHGVQVEGADNKTTYKIIGNCPKTAKNPYAPCPICDGQQIKRRVRHAANAWDYDMNMVKKLCQGEDVFKPIGTIAKMGQDVTQMDFAATRTGTGRDTSYAVAGLGITPFTLPQGVQLYDIEKEYAPTSVEEMMANVIAAGLKWEDVIVPPPLQYPPSLDAALNHVMPNTKYKGQTLGQLWQTEKGMIEFLSRSNRVSEEKAAAQVILVALGGQQIPGVPNYSGGGQAYNPTPGVTPVVQNQTPPPPQYQFPGGPFNSNNAGEASPTQVVTPPTPGPVQVQISPSMPSQPVQPAQQPIQPQVVDTIGNTIQPTTFDRQGVINQINDLLQKNQNIVKGGYMKIVELMQKASAPNSKTVITEFTDNELMSMLTLCQNQ